MKNLSLSLLITLLTSTLYAQNMGTINGVVKDKNTQEELIGVVLRFTGKDTINTITNENGSFSIQLPVGKYNLETSYIGYSPSTIYNINLSSGNAQVLQIELDEKSQE
ncbi:MAG: carboxypeptidase-like regulatory domain-containing protein, partial [Bacteroidetes bacterium]|nr:carboxypeptidase-like regulatory domain-containing protein [Bacteroidota bacterium]